MKMKVLALLVFVGAMALQAYGLLADYLLILFPPAIFFTVTTTRNAYHPKRSFYNDFPNTLRIFLSTLGGVLCGFLQVLPFLFGVILFSSSIFANDEAMRRLYRHKGVIVLSGIDATGKTTHASNICSWLKSKKMKCRLQRFHRYLFLDKLSNIRTTVAGGGITIPSTLVIPAKTSALSFIRPYLAFVDNLLMYVLQVVPCIIRSEHVVCDRFIWDNYVKHKALHYNTRFLFVLTTLIRPKIGIIFDVPSQVAVKRVDKRVDHYRYREEHYEIERREFKKIGSILGYTVINTNEPVKETWRKIEAYLTQFLIGEAR